MCGLYGYSKLTAATQRMNTALALRMEARGHDSWGCTDGDLVYKHLGSISDTWVDHHLQGAQLYHTRAASTGAVTEKNAHPFKFFTPEKTVIGAHNGILSNHYPLKAKHKRDTIEVDSEHIFMHLAEGKTLAEIEGYGAVVWWEYPTGHPEERKLYFSRFNNGSLLFAQLETPDVEIVWASTADAIYDAARFAGVEIACWYETKQKFKYTIEHDVLVECEELPWADAPVRFKSNNSHGGTNPYEGWRGHDGYEHSGSYGYGTVSTFHGTGKGYSKRVTICAAKGCTADITGVQFLCAKCLASLEREYLEAGV